MSNSKDKKTRRAMMIVILASIFLAMVSRLAPVSLDTPIPVANFYDRITGNTNSALYFLGMYLVALGVVPSITSELRGIGVAPTHRIGATLYSGAVLCFLIYLCILMPASTQIGGSKFSMLLSASAKWPIAQGFIYGMIFWCLSAFLGLFFLSLFGNRRIDSGHA